MKVEDIPEVKSLRWLANNFPLTVPAKDDNDRLCNCIHMYASCGADKIIDLARRLPEYE